MLDPNHQRELLNTGEFICPPTTSTSDEYSATKTCERFIAFYFGVKLYCVKAQSVAEVVHSLTVAVLPNPPGVLAGIAALRGEVIVVLDLKDALKEEGGSSRDRSKMIVLRQQDGQTQFAIPIDQLHEVVMLPLEVLKPSGGLVQIVEYQESVYNIIDLEKLSVEIELQLKDRGAING